MRDLFLGSFILEEEALFPDYRGESAFELCFW